LLFSFKDITYTLGFEQTREITVSGSVADGEALVVRGPSGAGKSTLLRILARLQSSGEGDVFLGEKNWLEIPATAWRVSVHYLAQKPALFDGTVAANLAIPFETSVCSKKVFDTELAKTIMNKILLPVSLWEQDARTLSGGEAARLTFVRALLIEPKILLLDEPTAALDENARHAFYDVLKDWLEKEGRAAVLISHINDYEGLKRVSFLDI